MTATGAILAIYAREMADTAERDDGEELVVVIGGVIQVVIEVEDQDRAKQFWTKKLGFELVQDAPYGNERWLEVRTPDRAVTLVLDLRKGPRQAAPDPAVNEWPLLPIPKTYSSAEAGAQPARPGRHARNGWFAIARSADGVIEAAHDSSGRGADPGPRPTARPQHRLARRDHHP